MLRVLLCITCCNAPSSRPVVQARGKNITNSNTNEKDISTTNEDEKKIISSGSLKGVESSNDKDLSLKNQIQAHNDNYRSSKGNDEINEEGKIKIDKGIQSVEIGGFAKSNNNNNNAENTNTLSSVRRLLDEDDNITATTSALLQKSRLASSNNDPDYRRYTEINFDDKSVSAPSSIDIEEFEEVNNSTNKIAIDARKDMDDDDLGDDSVDSDGLLKQQDDRQKVTTGESNIAKPGSYKMQSYMTTAASAGTTNLPTTSSNRLIDDGSLPSASETANYGYTPTTKIGHYARLEYSPIEDMDSLTSRSVSRPNSERYPASSVGTGGGGARGGASASRRGVSSTAISQVTNNDDYNYDDRDPIMSGTQSQRDEFSASASRRSSRRSSRVGGIESTSISISSQLSNEQFHQNLTSMLESATNSPTALFGQIGLPLGPPLEKEFQPTETRKTSPETLGAALTSASQDSLSGLSSENVGLIKSNKSILKQQQQQNQLDKGAALIDGSDSYERPESSGNNSTDLVKRYGSDLSKITTSTVKTFDSNTATIGADSMNEVGSRVQSAMSMATTTTSSKLTNPTPTPSELSGSGDGTTTKKKYKLRPKNLLKKLKVGKKKPKDETNV